MIKILLETPVKLIYSSGMNGVEFFDLEPEAYTDARGWTTNPIQKHMLTHPGFGHIHISSILPGAIRGNHYHQRSSEILFAFGGQYSFYYRRSDKLEQRHFGDHGLFAIRVNVGVAHALENTGRSVIYVMAYYDLPCDQETPDTIADKLIGN